ncbi:MAG: hypothetical protein EBW71_08280 [Betaproteobacteria bacterium]|nr:hypothetical protein [Betaproteobacteria bacterium]NCW98964.1 hypothetical protein [Betaproteobacteria bacterium]NCZ30151.1 hypothetical protein [Betaproteobacteria bacterium]
MKKLEQTVGDAKAGDHIGHLAKEVAKVLGKLREHRIAKSHRALTCEGAGRKCDQRSPLSRIKLGSQVALARCEIGKTAYQWWVVQGLNL